MYDVGHVTDVNCIGSQSLICFESAYTFGNDVLD